MVNSDLIAQNVLNTRDQVVEVNKLAVNQTRMTHEQYTHIGALSLSLSLISLSLSLSPNLKEDHHNLFSSTIKLNSFFLAFSLHTTINYIINNTVKTRRIIALQGEGTLAPFS